MQTPQEVFLGTVKADRSCGTCIACCVIPHIDTPELKKPVDTQCANCTGTGCAIHASRPEICRSFECGYKRLIGMPPEARPDRCGAMITIEVDSPASGVFDNIYYLVSTSQDPATLKSPALDRVVQSLSRGPVPIYIYWQGFKTLIHPPKQVAMAVLHPADASPTMAAEASRWLKAYAPYARAVAGPDVNLPPGY